MKRTEYADKLHGKKYNCCQSVVMSFADQFEDDEKTLFKVSEGFGLGMGGMQSICGALAGAAIVAGLKNSDGDLDDPKSKGATTKLTKQMLEEFEKRCGAIVCKDLKGVEPKKDLCSCPDCIRTGVELAEEILGIGDEM